MRDFEEEYKKYINEETPDLWNRIESQLEDREKDRKISDKTAENTTEKTTNKKIYSVIKRMIPAAAAIFILIIGISAVRNTQIAKMNDQTSMNETAYPQEAEMEYAEETAAADDIPESAAADEAADMPESAAANMPESESANADTADDNLTADTATSTDKTTSSAQQNGVGDKTENAAGAPTQELADGGAKETEVKNNNTSSVTDTLEVDKAVLAGISVADPDWKDQGYAYVYHFTTDDGDSIDALLSQSLCDELETQDITIRRKKAYHIVVTPIASDKGSSPDEQTAVCRLDKISE